MKIPRRAALNLNDVAPPKLDLEKVAVMSGAEQHGLPLERNARLPVLEDLVGDIARLHRLGLGADEVREFGRFLCRIKPGPTVVRVSPGGVHPGRLRSNYFRRPVSSASPTDGCA